MKRLYSIYDVKREYILTNELNICVRQQQRFNYEEKSYLKSCSIFFFILSFLEHRKENKKSERNKTAKEKKRKIKIKKKQKKKNRHRKKSI